MAFDQVIRGGTLIDGSGAPRIQSDIAIEDGRIAAIGVGLKGKFTVDATDCIVAPGFIDIHTHYDGQVFWDPALTPSSYHGVTSVIAGNCGFSLAPCRLADQALIRRTLKRVEDMDPETLRAGVDWSFESHPDYLSLVRSRGTLLNFGGYIGHTAVRIFVMGDEAYEREDPSSEQLMSMQNLVALAMDAGAVGFSSSSSPTHSGDGGRPVPSRLASVREVEALIAPLTQSARGVFQCTPGDRITHADLYSLQERISRPITWSALLSVDSSTLTKDLLQLHRRERLKGADVWPQVTCRPLTLQIKMDEPFTFNVAPAFRELIARTLEERIAAYTDPVWRARAEEQLVTARVLQERWETITVAESKEHPQLEGTSIAELAAAQGCGPLSVMIDVALKDGLQTRFRTVLANDDPRVVGELLREDGVMLGLSDAGAHVSQLCDACSPTDLLGNWVRERAELSLERAVHKLTGEPAQVFGIVDRGVIEPGRAADVVVFDPSTVGPGPLRRVSDFPAHGERLVADSPTGVRHVMVNGVLIREEGDPLVEFEQLPGQPIAVQ